MVVQVVDVLRDRCRGHVKLRSVVARSGFVLAVQIRRIALDAVNAYASLFRRPGRAWLDVSWLDGALMLFDLNHALGGLADVGLDGAALV